MKYSVAGLFSILGVGLLLGAVLFWMNPSSLWIGVDVIVTFVLVGLYALRIPTTTKS